MKKILYIIIMSSLVLLFCGCEKSATDENIVNVTFVSDTCTQTIQKKKNSIIKKSDVPFEQEVNILDLCEDNAYTISCLDKKAVEDSTIYVNINWGPDYVLSKNQNNAVIDAVYKYDKFKDVDIYYFGNYRGYILFNYNYIINRSIIAVISFRTINSDFYKILLNENYDIKMYHQDFDTLGEVWHINKILTDYEKLQLISVYMKFRNEGPLYEKFKS